MTLARRIWVAWLRLEFRLLAVVLPLIIAMLGAAVALVALYLCVGPIDPPVAASIAVAVIAGILVPVAVLLARPAFRLAAEIG